jgi:Carboxypeptidase regulatory-like domain
MRALLFTLTLLSALAQANSEPQEGAAYRISGVVVDAVTNLPVAHAQVLISRDSEQTAIVAGDDGRFVFEGLAAGKYSLSATRTGYVHEAYKQHGGFSVAIVTGRGQDTAHLAFRLQKRTRAWTKATVTARSVWEEFFPETTCFWRSRMVGIWSGRIQRSCGLIYRRGKKYPLLRISL